MFKWFDTTEVRAFAATTAADYARVKKSSALRQDDVTKASRKIEKISASVVEFERRAALNIYKKARLIDGLRTELRHQKVSEPEIGAFLNSILLNRLPAART